MRMMVALTVLLAAGILAVLWTVPGMDQGRLSETLDDAELIVAEEGPTEAPAPEVPVLAAEEPAPATGETVLVEEVPVLAEEPAPATGETVLVEEVPVLAEEPGPAVAEPDPTLEVPGLSPAADADPEVATAVPEVATPEPEPDPDTRTAEAEASLGSAAIAEAAPEPAAPDGPVPAEALDPADALASLAPELATPATPRAPPVRRGTALPDTAPATEVVTPAPEAPDPAEAAAPELATAAPAPETRRVTGDRVNLRAGPSTDTARLGLLSEGDSVEVLESEGDWTRIRTASGEEGWVSAQFLSEAG